MEHKSQPNKLSWLDAESDQDSNEDSGTDSSGPQLVQEKNHYYSKYDPLDLWVYTGVQKYWRAEELQNTGLVCSLLKLGEAEMEQIVGLTDERPLIICPFMYITKCDSRQRGLRIYKFWNKKRG